MVIHGPTPSANRVIGGGTGGLGGQGLRNDLEAEIFKISTPSIGYDIIKPL